MEQAHDHARGEADGVTDPNVEVPGASEARREIEVPRIYVASLSDYNAGILHGAWLDAASGTEDLWEGINRMLAASPTTRRYGDVAEEWAIHDYEGFGPIALGEYESIERVAKLAEGLLAHGEPFGTWWAMESRDDEDWGDIESQFEQQYLGEFSSLEDYGEQVLDDLGATLEVVKDLPENLRQYLRLDVEAFVHDLEAGGEIYTTQSQRGVYVFSAD